MLSAMVYFPSQPQKTFSRHGGKDRLCSRLAAGKAVCTVVGLMGSCAWRNALGVCLQLTKAGSQPYIYFSFLTNLAFFCWL
jgi:hypothetical protein